MEDRKVQERAAQTLLDKGEKLTVRTFGIRIRFTIRPLYLGAMIAMSEYISQIDGISLDDNNVFSVLGSAKDTVRPMAMATAHGILNKKLKRKLLARWLARVIINSMTPADLYKILATLTIRSDPQSFFGCTTLLAQMNSTRPRKKSEVVDSREAKQSGEQSQE